MTEAELKKIHGADVELAPDDSEDERLTEKDALAQAESEGILFVDHWKVDGDETRYETEKAAKKAAGSLPVFQIRERKGE